MFSWRIVKYLYVGMLCCYVKHPMKHCYIFVCRNDVLFYVKHVPMKHFKLFVRRNVVVFIWVMFQRSIVTICYHIFVCRNVVFFCDACSNEALLHICMSE